MGSDRESLGDERCMNSFWLEIGASFEHKDHKGLTIALQALPIDGRIVLRLVGSGPREKSDRRPEREDDPPRREEPPEEPTNWREPINRPFRKSGHRAR